MTEGTSANWRKSGRSYSSGGCVEVANWRKSRISMNNGNCLEAANTPAAVLVRDTTDRSGPVLAFGPQEWAAFTSALKGER